MIGTPRAAISLPTREDRGRDRQMKTGTIPATPAVPPSATDHFNDLPRIVDPPRIFLRPTPSKLNSKI
jgi:hypothetical protein